MRRVVRILILLFFLTIPSVAFAQTASFSITGAPASVSAGTQFTVTVQVRSVDQAINAISGTLLFPTNLLNLVAVSQSDSIINFWTKEPEGLSNRIPFEGVILNPGYQGSAGTAFKVTFEAKSTGKAAIHFVDGSILANDGKGTNLLASAGQDAIVAIVTPEKDSITIPVQPTLPVAVVPGKLPALPVITEYSPEIGTGQAMYVRGKGEPNAMTKLVFEGADQKSLGERFIQLLQTKRISPPNAYVENDAEGNFEYTTERNLLAGVYSATPFLVDQSTNTERPGLGARLLVSDSPIVRFLVILINVLALLIPVVGLIVVIYFIPWYSFRKMRVLKKQFGLEEEKLDVQGHDLLRNDRALDEAIKNLRE